MANNTPNPFNEGAGSPTNGIKLYDEGAGNGIESYKNEDPYRHDIDVRPLKNLANNDLIINSQLQSMIPKYPIPPNPQLNIDGELPDGTRRNFTFPNFEKAVPGSLEVFINGTKYRPLNIMLNSECTGFEISEDDIIPDSSDDFYFIYRVMNELNVTSETIEYETSGAYTYQVEGRRLLRGSVFISYCDENLIKDDLNGNLITIEGENYVGIIDYDTGEYSFQYDFEANEIEDEIDEESGMAEIISIHYQNYKE